MVLHAGNEAKLYVGHIRNNHYQLKGVSAKTAPPQNFEKLLSDKQIGEISASQLFTFWI